MQYITDWFICEDLALNNTEKVIDLYAKAGFSVKKMKQERKQINGWDKSRFVIEFEKRLNND